MCASWREAGREKGKEEGGEDGWGRRVGGVGERERGDPGLERTTRRESERPIK